MNTRRIESFLLRLVIDEQHSAEAQTWCGRIQHVASGCERQFEGLQEVLAFICEQFAAVELIGAGDDSANAEEDIPSNA